MQKLGQLVVDKIEEFAPQHVANIVLGYAKLGRMPREQAWSALEGALLRTAAQLNPQGVANTVWGYATLGQIPRDEVWTSLQRTVIHHTSSFNDVQLRELFQFHLTFTDDDNLAVGEKRQLLPDTILHSAQLAWKRSICDSTLISLLHEKVSAALHEIGMNHEIEHLTDDGVFSVDIRMLSSGGAPGRSSSSRLAIEVDGPTHFATNTREPLGPTVWRRQMLEARGYCVISLPYFELNRAEDLCEYIRTRVRG